VRAGPGPSVLRPRGRPRRRADTVPRVALLTAVVVLPAACVSSPVVVERGRPDGPTAERPTSILGERWIRGDGIYELIRIERLRGLEGLADVDRAGIVALQELCDDLEREVSARSRQVGGNQPPVLEGELEGSLPRVRVAPRPR
jgi:hypothetical protein